MKLEDAHAAAKHYAKTYGLIARVWRCGDNYGFTAGSTSSHPFERHDIEAANEQPSVIAEYDWNQ